jgi:hypothetical protein
MDKARREENRLFADLFYSMGVSDRLAIAGGGGDDDDITSRHAHRQGEELREARARDRTVDDVEKQKREAGR